MKQSHTVLTTAPFLLNDVPLGSLVPDIRYPNMDQCLVHKALSEEQFSKRPQENFKASFEDEKKRSLGSQLTKLLELAASKCDCNSLSVKADKGWIVELRYPKELFKELCEDENVRKWLQEGLQEGYETYFVVGLRTFEGTFVGKGQKASKGFKLASSLPVKEAIQANTGMNVGNTADVSGKVDTSKRHDEEETFETSQELIYAIEYREVHMRVVEKGAAAVPKLSKDNVWRYYSENRAIKEEGEEVPFEDYAASLLENELSLGDECQIIEDVDGSILILPGTEV